MSSRLTLAALLVPFAAASLGCKEVSVNAPASRAAQNTTTPAVETTDEARHPSIGPLPPSKSDAPSPSVMTDDATGGAVCITRDGVPYVAPEC